MAIFHRVMRAEARSPWLENLMFFSKLNHKRDCEQPKLERHSLGYVDTHTVRSWQKSHNSIPEVFPLHYLPWPQPQPLPIQGKYFL